MKRKSEKFERSCCHSLPLETRETQETQEKPLPKPVAAEEVMRQTQKITVDQEEEDDSPKLASCQTLQAHS